MAISDKQSYLHCFGLIDQLFLIPPQPYTLEQAKTQLKKRSCQSKKADKLTVMQSAHYTFNYEKQLQTNNATRRRT